MNVNITETKEIIIGVNELGLLAFWQAEIKPLN